MAHPSANSKQSPPRHSVFRTKSIEQAIQDTEEPEHRLRRDLSAFDLTVFGVGVLIGTGIFVLTGTAAKNNGGPAVALSFVVAGIVCACAALCYAEFASTIPVAGSAYTFSYASLGELPAWIIGWDLVLELALAAAVVAVGWSGYAVSLLDTMGLHLPASIAGGTEHSWGFNLPAALLVVVITLVVMRGIKLTSTVTTVIVAIKSAVVLATVVVGLFYVRSANYHPFIPPARPTPSSSGLKAALIQVITGFTPTSFGVMGIFFAAAVVFFAYIGFDVVSTAAEETRNPKRDLPIGIIASLAICTVAYVAVTLVVTGMQKYTRLSETAPLADAFKAVGQDWMATLISIGVVFGLASVVMILILGQSRVFFAMSRDRLLPEAFSKVHPRYRTPYRTTALLGTVVAVVAGVIPLQALAELVNIGTLFAFVVVSIGVIVLRRTRPDLPRSFRAPWVPVLPIISTVFCLWLMLNLPTETWIRFLVWMAAGFVVYFAYGHRRSRIADR
ncbi:amino acid permease [Mangrovactinospora gilvigrisea]|uniref:Amino acid permease n=1 Tax=Mangrovactinospora gilvigrisea TaxID=1428644 RepID=A0A1J7BAD2_9ACTN|nr:amino acid permease [Mangrovactinospora gilvigrisea]OIV35557.1 amino acid permease [Mangrovactinospora gilvigrisea]